MPPDFEVLDPEVLDPVLLDPVLLDPEDEPAVVPVLPATVPALEDDAAEDAAGAAMVPSGLRARTAATPITVPVPTMIARFIGSPPWSAGRCRRCRVSGT